MVDRVDVIWEYGLDRRRKWRDKRLIAANVVTIEYGRLADGRWYAERSDDRGGAYVYDPHEQGETLALRLAYRWMRDSGRQWWPTPAGFNRDGTPTDGLDWVLRDGEWVLAEPNGG